MRCLITTSAFTAILFSSVAAANLTLSAPPREMGEEGVATYGALAQRLGEVLGETVTYQQPKSWAEYAENLRKDKYDILFDGPHFTSWRIKHLGHQPVARLPGHLAFDIVARAGDERVKDLKSLRVLKVCAIASPNLTTSILLDQFRNEVAIPRVVAINGDMANILQALLAGTCDAAVLRDQYVDKALTDAQRAGLKVIYTTRQFPNQGVSVSRRLTREQVEKIADVLLQDDPSHKPITDRFAKQARQFIPSRPEDYNGMNTLLEGVVWGW